MKQLAKTMIGATLLAWGFWAYNASTGSLYREGHFANASDCAKVNAWVSALQATPSASPTPATPPNGLAVSPSCYPMEDGEGN